MGSAAHIRPGTLLEEEAGGAHAVGLKQTIFLPFVTAGLRPAIHVLLVYRGQRFAHGQRIGLYHDKQAKRHALRRRDE